MKKSPYGLQMMLIILLIVGLIVSGIYAMNRSESYADRAKECDKRWGYLLDWVDMGYKNHDLMYQDARNEIHLIFNSKTGSYERHNKSSGIPNEVKKIKIVQDSKCSSRGLILDENNMSTHIWTKNNDKFTTCATKQKVNVGRYVVSQSRDGYIPIKFERNPQASACIEFIDQVPILIGSKVFQLTIPNGSPQPTSTVTKMPDQTIKECGDTCRGLKKYMRWELLDGPINKNPKMNGTCSCVSLY